jgi:hypothetical protein
MNQYNLHYLTLQNLGKAYMDLLHVVHVSWLIRMQNKWVYKHNRQVTEQAQDTWYA